MRHVGQMYSKTDYIKQMRGTPALEFTGCPLKWADGEGRSVQMSCVDRITSYIIHPQFTRRVILLV